MIRGVGGDGEGEGGAGDRRGRLDEVEQAKDVADEDEERQTHDEGQEALAETVSDHVFDEVFEPGDEHFEDLLHSFAGHGHVIDVRNYGLMGVIELASREGAPGQRGFEIHKRCFWDENVVVRNGMDLLQFSPFLNSDPDEMEQSFAAVRRVLNAVA